MLLLFLARSDPTSTYAHVLKCLSKSEELVDVILNTYLMAVQWDFKLCCVASRLLFDLICCLEMEQIYSETVSFFKLIVFQRCYRSKRLV